MQNGRRLPLLSKGVGVGLSLQDRRDIDDLYIRYCYAINDGDVNGWVACFSSDGLFVPSFGPVRGEFRGAEQLATFAADPERHTTTRHWNANVFPWTDEEPVRSTCYGVVFDYAEPAPHVLVHVVYHDLLVREDGRWCFLERRPARDVV
jgi:hypothetical protein